MKLLLTLLSVAAFSVSAIAAGGGCGGGDCDDKGKKGEKEAATISLSLK